MWYIILVLETRCCITVLETALKKKSLEEQLTGREIASLPRGKKEDKPLMANKLFVGSLSYGVNDDQLADAFAPFGTVVSAKVIMDRETGRSKGFGFVEMSSDEEAQAAVKGLDGKEIGGRAVAVSEARPQENRERRPFNGDRGDRGDRGGNRY